MKARLVVATIAMCLLYGVSSAQAYAIRVTYNTNLRDASSLESAVIGSAPAGTTLQVAGKSGRWLRINWNGREVWMADWVAYSRVEGGEPTPGQATGDIDNCCFVDRQCQTDQDWTDGYWAFQNNQCGAPGQTGAPTSLQPVSGAPAQIDNCCFVDRQCNSDLEWAAGYYAFQDNQCRAPGQPGSPTSSQPVSGAPAQIDNCCFVDRQCHTDLDWAAGYYAFRDNQCQAPGQSGTSAYSQSAGGVILRTASGIVIGYTSGHGILPSTGPSILPGFGQIISYDNCCEYTWQCNSDLDWAAGYRALQNGQCALPGLISIVGAPDFVDQFERALGLLKNRLPHRYNYVLDGVDKVEAREGASTGINALRRTFFVDPNGHLGTLNSPPVERLSSVLVHEACHVHRSNAGYRIKNRCDREGMIREEAFCEGMELEVLIELDVEPSWIESQRDLIARIRLGEHIVTGQGC